ncbi:hypothetical protein Rsub_07876 [Raphidocelis subcapitata]|uniref:D-serine dehydratase-like domain-containing protein n=1 Tax=Raphidocelis subcapitata TaxID=307507 RepID=A0A2V0PB89_9CHLO|nr:hypothetical protein Rsub_07876 [Raphidocelis subcapitata]|eukprot:GBF95163.1 hypothetical protein Rsub_07876 [Raphidocelis subcapitata]
MLAMTHQAARGRAAGGAPPAPRWRPGGSAAACPRVRAAASFAAADAPPARVGDPISAVDTPALIFDLDVFEANCARMRQSMAAFPGVSIRPHAKAHKCPEVAALQLKLLGPQARGVCAQKVSEAEAMVAGGVGDVLLSNQVVGPSKLRRLAALAAGGARIGVVVDDAGALRELAAAAAGAGAVVDVLVEVNAGQDSPTDRAAAVSRVAARAAAAAAAIRAAGLECGTVTGGGTGTYALEAGSGVFTEVQPGSFIWGDAAYERATGGEWGGPGRQSLWVLTQVMSVSPGRAAAVVDAGLKAVSLDSGPPRVDASWRAAPPSNSAAAAAAAAASAERGGAAAASAQRSSGGAQQPSGGVDGSADAVAPEYKCGGDEHGILLYPQPGAVHALGPPAASLPPRGALLRLQPGHCDPTVNLFDWVVAYRGAAVEGVWRIAARGPGS